MKVFPFVEKKMFHIYTFPYGIGISSTFLRDNWKFQVPYLEGLNVCIFTVVDFNLFINTSLIFFHKKSLKSLFKLFKFTIMFLVES